MTTTQAAWVESAEGSTATSRSPYIATVPQDILEHPDTDIDTLKEYCRERGITFGERPSLQVLRAKLMASNADVQTVWSLRMTTLAAAAMTEAGEGPGHLAQFQAAIYHPPSVAADGPVGAVVAGGAPGPASSEMQPSPGPHVSKRTVQPTAASPCPPPLSQFRRPPTPSLPLMGSAEHHQDAHPVIVAAEVDPAASPGGTALPTVDGSGTGTRESDKLYLEYCRAKRAEEARDMEARRSAQHSELKSMMVSLGQSMANVAGAVQSHAASATVAAQRQTDCLVSISHKQADLLTAVARPAPTLGTMRSAKRQRTSGGAAGFERPPAGPPPATNGACEPEIDGVLRPVRRDMLFTATMEAELMVDRLVSSPLALQLQRIVRLAHVSPGKPGLFGSIVVHGLYERAGREAAEDSAAGALLQAVNKEKQRRIKNMIVNKADTYVRMLFWLRTVLPEVLETPAKEATWEKMEQFVMTEERRDKLQAALKLEAHKAKYQMDHVVLNPAKARMNSLRDLLCSLAVDHDYVSNVDLMLKTPPFAERLAEASRRIRPRYESGSSSSLAAP